VLSITGLVFQFTAEIKQLKFNKIAHHGLRNSNFHLLPEARSLSCKLRRLKHFICTPFISEESNTYPR